MTSQQILKRVLDGLNASQRKAVTSPPTGPLQIIAGPGTGKTKVLTSRVAYLMLEHKIRPERIIVTTFTKKAANEMKERLASMLKNTNLQLNRLIIGTFHSICARILLQYGHIIGLKKFKIAADRDWDDIMKTIIDPLTDEVADIRDLVRIGKLQEGESLPIEHSNTTDKRPYDMKSVKKQISRLKSKGLYPADYLQQSNYNKELHVIFRRFQEKLETQKMLDFDDLLIKTNQLLKKNNVLSKIEHVLVDEFQDTNTIQLELLSRFAKGNPINNSCITVVGDPDQSIYRFRDAVSINFELMRNIYKDCDIVHLNQNYRSTSGILNISEALMTQQKQRSGKSLTSRFEHNFHPVYQTHNSRERESQSIANEIELLNSLPGLFDYSSFSILVRSAYQTRALEKALFEKKIPYNIVKGKAFWERKEVEMIIDLLRMVAYDDDKPALLRTLQSQTAGFGPVTIKKIDAALEEGIKNGESAFFILNEIGHGKIKTISGTKAQNLVIEYTNLINEARSIAVSEAVELDALLKVFDYFTENGALRDSLLNEEEKQQNIAEVKNQLLVFQPVEEETLDLNGDVPINSENEDTLLQNFLSSIQLYSTNDKEGAGNEGAVCISTIHSAKGLEWPVVFVPGLTEGSLPASYATKDAGDEEALNEERRIFYVAVTRSQQLLYISSPLESFSKWSEDEVHPSRFISHKKVQKLMKDKQEALNDWDSVSTLYQSFNKPIKDEQAVKKVLKDYKVHLKRKDIEKQTQRANYGEEYEQRSYAHKFIRQKSFDQMGFSRPKSEDPNPLPPPGFKNYAPKVQSKYHPKINQVSSSTKVNRNSFSTNAVRNSSASTSHTATLNTNTNRAPISNITNNLSSDTGNPPKRKKTLGVRRRF